MAGDRPTRPRDQRIDPAPLPGETIDDPQGVGPTGIGDIELDEGEV
jgi:hypothetical protein